MKHPFFFTLLVLGCLFAHGVESAAQCPERTYDPVQDRAAAKKYFEAGLKYFARKFTFDALKAWECSYSIVPNHLVAFNIGRAAEATKKYEIALKYFQIFLRRAETPEQKRTVTERIRAVEEKLTLIEAKDGTVKWPEYQPPFETTDAVQKCPRPSGNEETDRKNAGHWYQVGLTHYQSKQFVPAMSAWLCSFRLVEHPLAAFNVARAAEKAGRYHVAMAYYREYLKRKPDAPDRTDVEAAISRVHAMIVQAERRAEAIRTLPEVPSTRPSSEPRVAPKVPRVGQLDVDLRRQKRPKLMLAMGWSSVTVAGVMGLVAGGLGLMALKARKTVEEAEPGTSWRDELAKPYSDYHSFSKGGWACMGIGVAALGAGVLLLVFDRRERARVDVAISPDRRGAALSLSGQF